MLPEGTIQCQAILTNKQQCALPAILVVNRVPFCRLHLNWVVGENKITKEDDLEFIKESERDEVNKILSAGKTDNAEARKV